METKLCRAVSCRQIKPINEFYKDRTKPDGHADICILCSKQYHKRWRKSSNKLNEYNKQYLQEKRDKDPFHRLEVNIRSRTHHGLVKAGSVKSGKTVELLGCSYSELRDHLESLFTEGMTWENYGKWEVDHIKPCVQFDLTDPEQQKVCFHYTNLQPLWRVENRQKGGSYGH